MFLCYSKEEQFQQSIEECIEKNSVNQSELINDIFLGWKRESILEREGLIVEGFATISKRAKYFTINAGDRIGPDYHKEQLFIEIFYNNDCDIFVHDPKFFTLNFIPLGLPALQGQLIVNNSESHFYPTVMTEVEELNLPQDPCNKDEKYDFQVDQFVWLYVVQK